MGQFKPMVKMMTTEPSVELKLKKGGMVRGMKKIPKMMNGGVMSGLSSAPAPGTRGGMMPAMAPKRPSMAARRAAMMNRPMMKEGGETKAEHAAEMKKMMGTEAKLKKHASMPASKAHKGLATGGVVMGQGGYKDGGIIKVAASEKGAKGYDKTMMHTAQGEHHTPKKTGEVVMGKPGGYKHGGKAKKMMGGGMAYAKGGGVEGNCSTSSPGVTNTTTGEVKLGNAGGYKKGGMAMVKKDGKKVPAFLAKAKGMMGGGMAYEKGGAPKKGYATGGLVDSGHAVAYPKKPASVPVSNDRQSGTFKKGGKVKYNAGGAAGPVSNYERDLMNKTVKPVKDPEATAAKAKRDLDEALNPVSMFKELGSKLYDKLRGQGAVTETEKSVTVSPPPAKKRAGGAC